VFHRKLCNSTELGKQRDGHARIPLGGLTPDLVPELVKDGAHERVGSSGIGSGWCDESSGNSSDLAAPQVSLGDRATVWNSAHDPQKSVRDEAHECIGTLAGTADLGSRRQLEPNGSFDQRGDGVTREPGEETLADRTLKLVIQGAEVYLGAP
jgi:hypothetical protein